MKNIPSLVIQRIKFGGRWLLPTAFLPSASERLGKAGNYERGMTRSVYLSKTDRINRSGRCVGFYTSAEYRSARWRTVRSQPQSKSGIGIPSYLSTDATSAIIPSTTFKCSSPTPSNIFPPLPPSSLPRQASSSSSKLRICSLNSSLAMQNDPSLAASLLSQSPHSHPSVSTSTSIPGTIGPRHVTSIGTFNARTLKSIWKRYELVNYMEKNKISIIAIQSHCIVDKELNPGGFNIQSLGKFKFIYSSADTSGVGGVGFIVCNWTYERITSITSMSSRVLKLCISAKSIFKNVLYSVYSPTACSDLYVRTNFFDFLGDCIEKESKRDMLIVLGDFNAVLPQNSLPSLPPNDNSNTFMEFIMANQLIASNTLFQKRPSQLYSFYGPNKRKTVLDYILVRTKWSRSCFDCNACLIPTVSSDHNAVIGKLKWTLARKSVQPTIVKRDLNLLNVEKIRVQVTDFIKTSLRNSSEPSQYSSFVTSSANAIAKFLPIIKKAKKNTPWTDADINSQRISSTQRRCQFLKDKSESNQVAMSTSLLELSELYKKKHSDFINNCCKTIEGLHGAHQSSTAWKLIDTLTGRKSRPEGLISANSSADRLDRWKSHFCKLLSSSEFDTLLSENIPVLEPILNFPLPLPEFRTGLFSLEELELALPAMKSNKTPGIDQISAELLKCPEIRETLLSILNYAYVSKKPYTEWLTQFIVPVHKKGSLTDCNNYRGIALMSITAKLFNRLILNRIKIIDPYLRGNQNGFRQNRSTNQQILAIRRLFETVKMYQKEKLLAIFIDFSKAFDSINWTVMERVLALYHVPSELVELIMMMYRGSAAVVKTKDGESTPIPLSVGVLQGDTLAPYLFIIMVDYVMRNSVDSHQHLFYQTVFGSKRSTSRGPKDEFMTDLNFADDIVLFPSSFENAQTILNKFIKVAATVGLRLNISKTEYLQVGDWKNESGFIMVNNTPLKKVEDYKYLGSWIFGSEKDMRVRIALAWKANTKLAKIWKCEYLSRSLKIRLFTSVVQAVLLYGAETWSLTKSMDRIIDGAFTKLLRYALNISWKDHISNDILYENLPRISQRIKRLRLQFAGHCFRDKSQPVHRLVFWKPRGKTMKIGQGRRITFDKVLMNDTGRSIEELENDMENRNDWRNDIVKYSKW